MIIELPDGVKFDRGVLVLGCGKKPYVGATNHDRDRYAPYVDIAWDLNDEEWPVRDEQYWLIIAEDVLEHLDSFIAFMDECWRILKPDGSLFVQVPRWDSDNVWKDPTHKRGYQAESFDYLDPDTVWGQKYDMYTKKKWQIVNMYDGDNIVAVMKPRKEE